MKKFYLNLIAIAALSALIVFLSSCSDSSTSPSGDWTELKANPKYVNQWIPIAEGNSWTYEAQNSTNTMTLTLYLDSTTADNYHIYYLSTANSLTTSYPTANCVTLGESISKRGKYYMLNSLSFFGNAESTKLTGIIGFMGITDTDALISVETPYGIYQAYKRTESYGTVGENYVYFVPGLGIVKIIDNYNQKVWYLKSVKLK